MCLGNTGVCIAHIRIRHPRGVGRAMKISHKRYVNNKVLSVYNTSPYSLLPVTGPLM
jgi:hypothetical protein